MDEHGYRKFGMRDKIAYAAGDFGCNMSFALKSYLTLFWTQYMGLDPVLMASLLLLVQVWDAINDPVIGSMIDADRRQYKRNKFLQYVHIGSIGLMVAGAACFIPLPQMPYIAKNILFVVGYIFWDAFYTIANVPYGSMMSLITTDAGERAQLSTWRSAGAMVAGILLGSIIPMLIFDASSNLLGDRIFIMALIFGVLGFFTFQFMIRNTEIRVDTSIRLNEETPKFNPVKATINYAKNRAAIGVTISAFAEIMVMYGISTANMIMFQSYFNNAQISGLLSTVAYFGMFLYMPFIGKIVGKFGKKEAVLAGMTVTVSAYLLMFILPITPDTKGMIMFTVCQLVASLGVGIYSCVSWSFMADAMDYGEWKFGVREEGTTYALYSFFRKLAQGIGPSVGLVLAAMLGYDETLGAAQTAETAVNMLNLVRGGYVIGVLVQMIGIGLVFNLDKKTLAKIHTDLEERREAE
ncbi:MAG: MFS transporter [Agathobacter sp.]|nr:MFS transporter [Agathobacter sp.]